MIALSLTIFVSLCLAVFFVGLFLIQEREGAGQPHDALLPIEGEERVLVKTLEGEENR
jgi:preprotein translocase subunit SecG